MTKRDETLGLATMYANWGYAAYELGDKVAIIAGSSLYPTAKFKFINLAKAFMLNEMRISSFDFSEQYLEKMVRQLNQFKPKYIRGYASSIYTFANFIKEKKLKLEFQPKGIFTTAEVLFGPQREILEEVFACKVFDQYGMNDGGVSAYECEMHSGMHIDMLRSIMEVVDENGHKVKQGEEGHVLATSLHNFAFPFIRYDTKDLGVLAVETCTCGRKTQLIHKIVGRVSDFIHTPEGRRIHGEFFTHIFWEIEWAKQFQIIQKGKDRLVIKIVPNRREDVDNEDLERMKSIISNRTGSMELELEIVDVIKTTRAGKWRFIIREDS
jgi:phenylacetate-CoA ligase